MRKLAWYESIALIWTAIVIGLLILMHLRGPDVRVREHCGEMVIRVDGTSPLGLDDWRAAVADWEAHGAPHIDVEAGDCPHRPAEGVWQSGIVCATLADAGTYAADHAGEFERHVPDGADCVEAGEIRLAPPAAWNKPLELTARHELGHVYLEGRNNRGHVDLDGHILADDYGDNWRGVEAVFAK